MSVVCGAECFLVVGSVIFAGGTVRSVWGWCGGGDDGGEGGDNGGGDDAVVLAAVLSTTIRLTPHH
ncbi:hypothetical protein Hanom_Chr04g00344431 [Helianthus anomalus]